MMTSSGSKHVADTIVGSSGFVAKVVRLAGYSRSSTGLNATADEPSTAFFAKSFGRSGICAGAKQNKSRVEVVAQEASEGL